MSITLILFVFGVIFGSFLNVVGTRFNSGVSLMGRSFCPKCGHELRWFELVPIFSYLFQRGRCRICRVKISPQYPIIEIFTGLIFLSIFNLQFSIYNKIILLLVFSIYIVIAVYDLRHKIIPDLLVYLSIVFGLIVPLFIVHYSLLDWLAGPILFLFFGMLWLVTQGRAIGFGDAKLALSIGLLLGGAWGFSAVIMAFWIGAAVGIFAMIFSRKKITMKSEIPFAPFLILGAWLALVFNLDLLHVSLF